MDKIKHYKILDILGTGAMGAVYKAFDAVLEREVAIKVMHPHLLSDSKNADRFLREARAAAKLVHPNVVTIHEIGEADQGRYIVMEYVQGQPLTGFIPQDGFMDWRKAVNLTCQILKGLSGAHELSILHRDIKTDNIIVTPSDQVKILDFGIAKLSSQMGLTMSGDILGTVEYMPPEQMMGEELDNRCDIYACGIVLYQLVTNKFPFSGDSAVTVLYQKLNEDPIPPIYYNKDIPERLNEVILKAIDSDKLKRWEKVSDFIEALENVVTASQKSTAATSAASLTDDDLLEEVLEESEDSRHIRNVFVGRRNEFRSLIKIFDLVKKGKGQTVILQGEAGVGKTTLANYLRGYVQRKKAWVLYGACLYQEGMDAYLPYIDAFRAFFSHEINTLPESDRRKIKEIVREKVPLLLEFTERFTTTFGQTQAGKDKKEDLNQVTLVEGLFVLLSQISTIRPIVLIVDDMQWADDASLRMFHYLIRMLSENRVMQIGIFRADRYDLQRNGKPTLAMDVLSRIRKEGTSNEIQLKRLTREESDLLIDEALVRTIFSEEFYQRLYDETKGNPFFLLETLKMLRENGAIYHKDGVWYDDQDWKKVVVPNRVEDVFIRRLSALSDEDHEMLQVAAVIGNKFDASILSAVLEMSKIKLLRALQQIQQDLQIIASTEDGFQFEHPMLREMLYYEIPNALRREYHLLLADVMEKMHPGNLGALVGEVAEHLRRGGNFAKAIPLLYQAGVRNFRLAAYKESSSYFENLLDVLAETGHSLPEEKSNSELYLKLGICYDELARWQEGIDCFEKMNEICIENNDYRGQTDSLLRMGSLNVKLGDTKQALLCYEKSLQIATEHKLSTMLGRLYNNIGIVHFQEGNHDIALRYFERTADLSDSGEGLYDFAHAMVNSGTIYNIRGEHESALEKYQQALNIYKEKNDQKRMAQVYHNIGITYSDMERWNDSIDSFNKCFDLANDREDKNLIALTNLNLGKVYLRQKEFEAAKSYADKAAKFFRRVSDLLSIAEVNYIYGVIFEKNGELEKAEKYFNESLKLNEENNYFEGYAEVSEAFADFYDRQGEKHKAEEYYSKAAGAFEKINALEKLSDIELKLKEIKGNGRN